MAENWFSKECFESLKWLKSVLLGAWQSIVKAWQCKKDWLFCPSRTDGLLRCKHLLKTKRFISAWGLAGDLTASEREWYCHQPMQCQCHTYQTFSYFWINQQVMWHDLLSSWWDSGGYFLENPSSKKESWCFDLCKGRLVHKCIRVLNVHQV